MDFKLPIDLFQKEILNKFKKYKWSIPDFKNGCIENSKKQDIFTLNDTQNFVSSYTQPSNPNGLLLWHSVGSGKTLSAVAILKNFEKQGYNTLWITRKTLKKDLQKALVLLPLKNHLTVISYKQFSNIIKIKGKLYEQLLERARKINKNTDDPLYKTIIIIDEVHKLYTRDLKPQEMHDIHLIQQMIFNSYKNEGHKTSCKVILMSATPITEDPMEIIQLFNLLITNPKNRFDINKFKDIYLNSSGNFTKKGIEMFQNNIKDLVSYIDMSKDPRKFAQVEYTEILVPLSVPSFSKVLLEPSTCKKDYDYCKSLNLNVKECVFIRDKCLKNIEKYKKILKNNKYQSSILKSKCNIDLE